MQLHQIQVFHKLRRGKRVGRGGKRGTYSGRGTKGQRARAGAKIRPQERDILKRVPKLRGYKFKPFRAKPAVVNFSDLEKKFKEGDIVTPAGLWKSGLVRRVKGKIPAVKILGRGEHKKQLRFKEVLFSHHARKKLFSHL